MIPFKKQIIRLASMHPAYKEQNMPFMYHRYALEMRGLYLKDEANPEEMYLLAFHHLISALSVAEFLQIYKDPEDIETTRVLLKMAGYLWNKYETKRGIANACISNESISELSSSAG